MTWVYDSDSDHWAFSLYEKDQMVMYNAIVTTVQRGILTNDAFYAVIPNATAVQNGRTSSVPAGNLTRDGYHLSGTVGRYLAGLTMVATIIDPNLTGLTWKPDTVTEAEMAAALIAAKNAITNPFEVTPAE